MRWLGIATLLFLSTGALAQPRDRVISAGGALTEIVFALGADDRVIAVDTTSSEPAEVAALPKIGYMRALSSEGVLALRPQLLLAVAEVGPPAALRQIRDAGVRVVNGDADHSIEGVKAKVRLVAQALGLSAAGVALESKIDGEWRTTQLAVGMPARPVRVLFVLAHGGTTLSLAGAETAADAMIRYAGGTNAMSGFKGFRAATVKAVVAAQPDVILVTREGIEALGGVGNLLAKPGFALTPAGRTKNVASFDALYLLGFGPRTPQAVRELAERLRKS